jgi:DNA invertase Pin-like site-specific DNA recombinase
MLKALAYVRVSTKEQEEQPRQSFQIQTLSEYCISKGWEFEIVPEAFSGRTIHKRKRFNEVLDRLGSEEAKVLVVHTVDRLSRSLKDALEIYERSQKEGWKIHITTMNPSELSEQNWFQFTLMMGLAQQEVMTLSKRTLEGMNRAKSEGRKICAEAREPLSPEIRDLIIKMRKKGVKARESAEKLNALGYKSMNETVQSGSLWTAGKVYRIWREHDQSRSKGSQR